MTDFEKLQEVIRIFVDERSLDRLEPPKELAIALCIEAAELLEIFQWRSASEPLDDNQLKSVRHEIADVLIYLLRLADKLEIDLNAAVLEKMEINRSKHPVAPGSAKS